MEGWEQFADKGIAYLIAIMAAVFVFKKYPQDLVRTIEKNTVVIEKLMMMIEKWEQQQASVVYSVRRLDEKQDRNTELVEIIMTKSEVSMELIRQCLRDQGKSEEQVDQAVQTAKSKAEGDIMKNRKKWGECDD